MVITDAIRAACAQVAEQARSVRINTAAIPAYAAALPAPAPLGVAPALERGVREREAAFWLTLDAINFGSGWFPTLRKRSQPTGYRTVAAGIRRRFDEHGRWSAAQLELIRPAELAALMDQDPGHQLMALFATSLRDMGAHLQAEYGGSYTALVDAANGSAVELVTRLRRWRCFADTSRYHGLEVPFLKRAQITAADLQRAGVARFSDIGSLTLFADNLVPHVLALDGVLELEPGLRASIARGELLEHGSDPEVELRACAVHAAELIVAAAAATGVRLNPAELDQLLWNRGQGAAYKAVPRPRSRCTAY